MFKKINFTPIIGVLLISALFANSSEIDSDALKFKSISSVTTNSSPKIDGNLDDAEWANAIVLDDFIQYEPYNLESPSVETEVRVLYDDNYVYIAFQNYDPDPSSIMNRISRRDDYEAIEKNVDWVGFGIDSNNDDMTGNWFMLTAAEVQLDVSINESGGWRDKYDISWNAVWDGKTQIHSEGWSAEIRIPFNVFQFSKNEIQTWGGTFQRGYFKDQEQIHWPGRSKPVPTPASVDITLPKLLTSPTSKVPLCMTSGCNNDSVKDQFVALEFMEYCPASKVTALVVAFTLKPPN